MKIYTRRGDSGETDLFRSGRVPKNDPRIEALGDLDELVSWLGVVRAHNSSEVLERLLEKWQRKLFLLGGELASTNPEKDVSERLRDKDVGELEEEIDWLEKQLPPLDSFVIPSGTPCSTFCHLARAVCRRLERKIVALENVSPVIRAWVNRFSDMLFVLGRYVNTLEPPKEKS
ncbi:MAG: cob(I)yrinic acid a,c-diamide adenosyltransferase [Planctomycetia bacterium]|nr:cob(I)yrinic acid a,c-diamide adenosyltransferase [Planctomycetia bacterium]